MTLTVTVPSIPICPTSATISTYDIPDFVLSTMNTNYEIPYTLFIASSPNCIVTHAVRQSDLVSTLPGSILQGFNTTHIVLNFDSSYFNT